MSGALDRFSRQLEFAIARNSKQLRFGMFLAALIALLLWRTQWLALRAGLATLLVGQLATTVLLIFRNRNLSQEREHCRAGTLEPDRLLAWFDEEESFIKSFALRENAFRLIGFFILAYGFWVSTGNLAIAIAIGIVYPLTVYFGMVRPRQARTLRLLAAEKAALADHLVRS